MLAWYMLSSCVCPSVTSLSTTKMAEPRITQAMPYDSPGTLVCQYQRSRRNSNGVTPNGGPKYRWGWFRLVIVNQYLSHRRRSLFCRAGSCPSTFQSLWAKTILCPPTFCCWKCIFCRNPAIFSSANPTKMLLLELLFWPWICNKSFVGWGFAPDPTEGAYSAPPDLLAAFKETYF